MKRYHIIDYGPALNLQRFRINKYILLPDLVVHSFHDMNDALTVAKALNDKPALLEEFRKETK